MTNEEPEIYTIRIPPKSKYAISDLSGISKKCDWFIFENTILNISGTDKPNCIFIKTSDKCINTLIDILTPLQPIKWRIVLIIGAGDATFPKGSGDKRFNFYEKYQKIVNDLINSPFIKHIWVENLDTQHIKLRPIPTGYAYIWDKFKYSLYKPFLTTYNINYTDKIHDVFCCHMIREGPQWFERKIVKDLALSKWTDSVTYTENINEQDYINYLIKSKFCICVHGGGIDPSPKAWQALLCGCIPIIKSSTVDAAYNKFPIIFIDDWTDDTITREKILTWTVKYNTFYEDNENRRNVLNMLTLNYWWDIIREDFEKPT